MRISLVDNLLVDNMFVLESREERRARERISPGLSQQYTAEPNLGLLSLAAVARAAGHEPSIFWPMVALRRGELSCDGGLYAACAERVLATNPDVVGLTTMACSMLFTARVAQELKARRPDLPVVVGGPHASILHRQLLARYRQIDVVVRHEAEETFPLVLERFESRRFEDVPGVTWRHRGLVRSTAGAPTIADLDALPFPDYHLFPLEEITSGGLSVEAGRGCPFACTFCSTNTFFGRKFRVKSADKLVADLDRLHARYGYASFRLQHDLFTVDRRKIFEFCEAVKGRNYTWTCSARVDCVDDELLEAMAGAGCNGMFFGIETGSARMQRVTKKKLTLDLVEPTLRTTGRLGIRSTTAFIIGFPEEEQQDLDDTLECMRRCAKHDHVNAFMSVLAPEPGTALQEASGGELLYDGELGTFNATLFVEGDEEVVRNDPEMFTPYFYYRSKIPRPRVLLVSRAYSVLLRLEHRTLHYALRFFGGSLARFMAELENWAAAREPRPAITPAAVIEFFAQRFGEAHHLVSLLHYELDSYYVRVPVSWSTEADRLEAPGRFDPARPHRLSRRAVLYPLLHDCVRLWASVDALDGPEATLDDAAAGPRKPHLVLGHGRSNGRVDCFAVEPATFELLEAMRSPQSYEALRDRRPDLDPGPGLFRELVALGVLTPCPAAEARAPEKQPPPERVADAACA
jgi:radical SAM superfamily enzyme YgiQ (UPF0313 family)